MEKNLKISMLFDFYGSLLTDKQQEAVELYYEDDLSLAEIAQQLDITRQGVYDNIKRSEKQLIEYENLLGLVDRFSKVSRSLDALEGELENLDMATEDKKRISGKIDQIKELL